MIFPSSLKTISVTTRLQYSSQPFSLPRELQICMQRFSATGRISMMVHSRKSYLFNMALNNALILERPDTGCAGGIHSILSSQNQVHIRFTSCDFISAINARILSSIRGIYEKGSRMVFTRRSFVGDCLPFLVA